MRWSAIDPPILMLNELTFETQELFCSVGDPRNNSLMSLFFPCSLWSEMSLI